MFIKSEAFIRRRIQEVGNRFRRTKVLPENLFITNLSTIHDFAKRGNLGALSRFKSLADSRFGSQ